MWKPLDFGGPHNKMKLKSLEVEELSFSFPSHQNRGRQSCQDSPFYEDLWAEDDRPSHAHRGKKGDMSKPHRKSRV